MAWHGHLLLVVLKISMAYNLRMKRLVIDNNINYINSNIKINKGLYFSWTDTNNITGTWKQIVGTYECICFSSLAEQNNT